jgi:hypothetical protein
VTASECERRRLWQEREEAHTAAMQYKGERQELCMRITEQRREDNEFSTVHVGYLVSGPKMCAPPLHPHITQNQIKSKN